MNVPHQHNLVLKMNLQFKTLADKTVKLEFSSTDTLKTILDKILSTHGISADEIVFPAEQPQEDISIQSTPDLFESEDIESQNSDTLWTPGSIKTSQEKKKIPGDKLFLITFDALRPLFSKCSHPGCGAKVHEEDVDILVKGAGLLISSVCTQLHITKWRSAEFFNKVRLNF